jgi:hypothetical protein
MINLDSFYSENPISSWKVVLGEDMHYHYGVPGENPFEQAILNVMEFIPPNSKVLDCGCGWGGPGRVLQKHGHSVTGVTNSKQQAEYIQDFPVIYGDLHEFIPEETYDAAIFIESYFHLINPVQVFDNLVPNVKNIVILDIVSDKITDIGEFGIKLEPKEYMMGNLRKAGYVIKNQQSRLDFADPTIKYWRNNIDKLPPEEIYGHIGTLRDLCHGKLDFSVPRAKQIIMHAQRR